LLSSRATTYALKISPWQQLTHGVCSPSATCRSPREAFDSPCLFIYSPIIVDPSVSSYSNWSGSAVGVYVGDSTRSSRVYYGDGQHYSHAEMKHRLSGGTHSCCSKSLGTRVDPQLGLVIIGCFAVSTTSHLLLRGVDPAMHRNGSSIKSRRRSAYGSLLV